MVFSDRPPKRVRKMSPKAVEKLIEEMGGEEEAIRQGFDQYEKDRVFLDKNFQEWLKLYPDHWVAVFMEELIVVEKDIFKLSQAIKEKNIPRQYTAPTAFLDTKPPKTWILSSQKELVKAA